MICGGFLSKAEGLELRALARDGRSEGRGVRQAKGWGCEAAADALLIDDDTVRCWWKLYDEHGLTGLVVFDIGGSQSRLLYEQESALFNWVRAGLPRSAGVIGAWILENFGLDYSRPGLLHRLVLVYRKPDLVPHKLNAAKQKSFIEAYERLMRGLAPDETVVFADAVHPTHQVRPVGCWALKDQIVAIAPCSGRLNIHGAGDLETGKTQMLEVPSVDARSTILLPTAILAAYPSQRVVHVFLDNARYHHGRLVQAWPANQSQRIRLYFVPPYSTHINSIERLWGVMRKNRTHNQTYATFREVKAAIMAFLTKTVPKNWPTLRDTVTDNFRIINPADFQVLI